MANPILRAILSSLLFATAHFGSTSCVRSNVWMGHGQLIGPTFVPKAQLPKIAMDPQGNAIAVWAQGHSTGTLSSGGAGMTGGQAARARPRSLRTIQELPPSSSGDAQHWQCGGGVDPERRHLQQDEGKSIRFGPRMGHISGNREQPRGCGFCKGGREWQRNAGALEAFNGVNYHIWANQYVVGQGWGTATLIETSSQDASETWVAMDNSGNAIAVWRQSDGVARTPVSGRTGMMWGQAAGARRP